MFGCLLKQAQEKTLCLGPKAKKSDWNERVINQRRTRPNSDLSLHYLLLSESDCHIVYSTRMGKCVCVCVCVCVHRAEFNKCVRQGHFILAWYYVPADQKDSVQILVSSLLNFEFMWVWDTGTGNVFHLGENHMISLLWPGWGRISAPPSQGGLCDHIRSGKEGSEVCMCVHTCVRVYACLCL